MLEEYLKAAREAEIVDPRKGVAEDKERGIRAVVRVIWAVWRASWRRPKW